MAPAHGMIPVNEPEPLATTSPPGRIIRALQPLAQSVRCVLGATPVTPPTIDAQFTRLGAVERAAEVLRYTSARFGYWLSPGGTLRAVLRASLALALVIAIPTITVGPAVILLLEGAAAASSSLAIIVANLAALSLSLITAVIGFAVLIALIRSFLRRK